MIKAAPKAIIRVNNRTNELWVEGNDAVLAKTMYRRLTAAFDENREPDDLDGDWEIYIVEGEDEQKKSE